MARGALLADSMGLGKTATAVVAAFRADLRRVLVVCPKSAIPDWRREIDDWHPRPGTVRTVHSNRPWLDFDNGFALINYELLQRFAADLRRWRWDLVVFDEGHATKEPSRRRTVLIYGGVWKDKPYRPIPARKKLVISGTPMKNRVEEMFTTLNFLDPDNWPDRDAFIDAHYEEETGNGDPRIVTAEGRVVQNVAPRNLNALHRRLKETVLVRTHKDDVEGLPPRRFEKVAVPLDDAEDRDWFDSKARTALLMSRKLRAAQRDRDVEKTRGLEERLRQIRSAIYQHATRAKRQAVLDYLLALPPEHKAIVIGFHRDLLLDQLADALRARGRRLVEHNGDNSARAAATVHAFQTRPELQFFLGQLSVSNLSLTLTAASHVVFAEIPQTRADLDQAVDRVHRFGQERECTATVFALDWESAGDEELLDALAHWKEVSDAVLDGREGGAACRPTGTPRTAPGGLLRQPRALARASSACACSRGGVN
jgi:SWI/SNF-related matrix-associated actin-dependent regulator of chromatin subfamily A-like protein 1